MKRDQDLRLKLTSETHAVLLKIAALDRVTLQVYVERLIADHCNARLDNARQILSALEGLRADAPVSRNQFLYFIQKGAEGPIKIGVTNSVSSRMKALQTGSSEVLTLLWSTSQADGMRERELHRRFKHLRLDGEWFSPGADLLAFIATGVAGK